MPDVSRNNPFRVPWPMAMGLLGTRGNLEYRWGILKRLWGNLEHENVCALYSL